MIIKTQNKEVRPSSFNQPETFNETAKKPSKKQKGAFYV